MLRKLIPVLILMVTISLALAQWGTAAAQPAKPYTLRHCPPYDPLLMQNEAFMRLIPPECKEVYGQKGTAQELLSASADVIPLGTGGPDSFGYTYNDAAAYSWISASTKSLLTGDDAYFGPVNIGFSFPFYGMTQTQLYFNTNGLVTFGEGSSAYFNRHIPDTAPPNNLIAAFWDDLAVGSPYNAGAVYYSQGGTAPNRYFVVEWRNVSRLNTPDSFFSFEVILKENGDIIIQHQSLPSAYSPTVGIEGSSGDEGLHYFFGTSGLTAPKAILFTYPIAATARVMVSPIEIGKFTSAGTSNDFLLTISNTGTQGADVYDLIPSFAWNVDFFKQDGVTGLVDTDSDTFLDTGPIPQSSSINIIARVMVPNDALVGDKDSINIQVRSSVDTTKSKNVSLDIAIPAPFFAVFRDDTDGAMQLDITSPKSQATKQIAPSNYFGYAGVVTAMPNGNIVYAWSKGRCLDAACNTATYEIEYTLLDHAGNVVRPIGRLTDNSGSTMYTEDYSPSVSVAPNGTIGIAWGRYRYDGDLDKENYNIFFATLASNGNLLSGPINLTNSTDWTNNSEPNPIGLYNPTVAATSDNRFVLGWQKYVGNPTNANNVWYAVLDRSGVQVKSPSALTTDNQSAYPFMNNLTGGKAIVTYWNDVEPGYAIINSSGAIIKAQTSLGNVDAFSPPDAVQLPNGKVALAWPTSTGVGFTILNSSYEIENGPEFADTPRPSPGVSISVTTDISSRVIMTWLNNTTDAEIFYALGNSTGTFITEPMTYKKSNNSFDISYNGLGNAPNTTFADVPLTHWAASWIERLYNAGITGGCRTSPTLMYCPSNPVNRAQMAVFLLKAKHGTAYTPPPASGVFGDVTVAGNFFAPWIEQLYNDGITGGCSTNPLLYCPNNPVTRAQMAIFLLKAKYGSSYQPPAATGMFEDVPITSFTAPFIEQLANEGITGGCNLDPMLYCPGRTVTRDQMAIFLVKTFSLP